MEIEQAEVQSQDCGDPKPQFARNAEFRGPIPLRSFQPAERRPPQNTIGEMK